MNPSERIDCGAVRPAEMEPDRVGLLFSSLELEEITELAGE